MQLRCIYSNQWVFPGREPPFDALGSISLVLYIIQKVIKKSSQ